MQHYIQPHHPLSRSTMQKQLSRELRQKVFGLYIILSFEFADAGSPMEHSAEPGQSHISEVEEDHAIESGCDDWIKLTSISASNLNTVAENTVVSAAIPVEVGRDDQIHAKICEAPDEDSLNNAPLSDIGNEGDDNNGRFGQQACTSAGERRASAIRYGRDELLSLQFDKEDQQLQRWNELVIHLGQVAVELHQMERTSDNCPKPRRRNADRRQRSRKFREESVGAKADQIPGPLLLETLDEHLYEELPLPGFTDSNASITQASGDLQYEEEEDFENSEDEMDSLQKLAFVVEGEPDFDSGPPQDGLEYLRRVKWEAAQFPKVKVAKIDPRKLNVEQTPYVPYIPSVLGCSKELLPSKDWEMEFLVDFSNLRIGLSGVELSDNARMQSLPSCRNKAVWKKLCFGDTHSLASDEDSCFLGEENEKAEDNNLEEMDLEFAGPAIEFHITGSFSDKDPKRDSLGKIKPANSPLLPVVLSLDEVARATLFKYHVSWLEDSDVLSKDQALWLFALSAVLDKPLDAGTSAVMRAMLRKCAHLRASKTGDDEELSMLNILITIAGKYFRQADELIA